MRLFSLCVVYACCCALHAGEIQLNNGDVISGELKQVEAQYIVWQSPLLGELQVNKAHIAVLATSQTIDLSAQHKACILLNWQQQTAQLDCQGAQHNVTVSSLKTYIESAPKADVRVPKTASGKLRFTGSQSHGNKNQQHWDVAVSRKWEYGDYRHIAALAYENNSSDNSKADEEYELDYQFNWFFNHRWFLYADTNAERDDAKSIEERYALGAGVGYQAIQTDKASLSIELGGQNAKENIENGDDNDLNSVRWQTDYEQELVKGISIFHKHDILAVSNQADDWEFKSDTGLSIPLGAGISAQIKAEYDFDNRPLLNNKKEDITTTFGVGYDW